MPKNKDQIISIKKRSSDIHELQESQSEHPQNRTHQNNHASDTLGNHVQQTQVETSTNNIYATEILNQNFDPTPVYKWFQEMKSKNEQILTQLKEQNQYLKDTNQSIMKTQSQVLKGDNQKILEGLDKQIKSLQDGLQELQNKVELRDNHFSKIIVCSTLQIFLESKLSYSYDQCPFDCLYIVQIMDENDFEKATGIKKSIWMQIYQLLNRFPSWSNQIDDESIPDYQVIDHAIKKFLNNYNYALKQPHIDAMHLILQHFKSNDR